MSSVYTEEHNEFQIDLSKAGWSLGNLKDIYKTIGNILNDVDWVAETEDSLMLIEFKNWRKGHIIDDMEQFYQNTARKFYGTAYYLMSIGKTKPMSYVLVIASPPSDNVINKRAQASIMKRLPFRLQENPNIERTLILSFKIFGINDWNEAYPFFPLTEA